MSKDSNGTKSAKIDHHMEKVFIKNLLSDSENENVDMVLPIEAAYDSSVVVMKHNQENKTTKDFLVGNTNEMNLHEIYSIECKSRCASRNEEREINKWDDSKHMKINYDYPNFSNTFIEKSEAMQCLHHASVLGFSRTLLLITNKLEIVLQLIWIIFPEGMKIAYLITLKTYFNTSMKWACEDLPPPKSFQSVAKN